VRNSDPSKVQRFKTENSAFKSSKTFNRVAPFKLLSDLSPFNGSTVQMFNVRFGRDLGERSVQGFKFKVGVGKRPCQWFNRWIGPIIPEGCRSNRSSGSNGSNRSERVLGSRLSIEFYIGIVGQVFASSRPIIQLTIVAKDPSLNEGQASLGHEMRLANVWITASWCS
jgi:hypothetical protein